MRSRISAACFGMVAAALVLVLLLIFILQNTRSVKIRYFTVSGTIPVGVSLFSLPRSVVCCSPGWLPHFASGSSIIG